MKNINTQCRLSFDAFHVQYITGEDENFNETDTRNLTHVESYSENDFAEDESECSWTIDFADDRAQLSVSLRGDDFDVHQFLSEEVCFQLADMFGSAAVILREKRRQEEIKEARAQAMVQTLPFETNDGV